MPWRIENAIPDRVSLAWFSLDGVTVRPEWPLLEQEMAVRTEALRTRYANPASAVDALAPARRLYHALGIDPSKHRPSSEALLRRVLLGKGLYTVNTAVDAANLTSLVHFLPVGLYDADRITPETSDPSCGRVTLRRGLPGEEYPGIRKERIHLEGRPALFDRVGPFGNPSADSERTQVTLETRRLLFVLFAPSGLPERDLEDHRAKSLHILQRHLGGMPGE